MRRWLKWVAAVVCIAALLDSERMDIGQLQPAELLYLYKENGMVCIRTDTGDSGVGVDVPTAVENLQETALGTIFLNTADYLVLAENAVVLLMDIQEFVRPSTEVCWTRVEIDTQNAAKYLCVHSPGVTVQMTRAGTVTIPQLLGTKERYNIVR